MKLKIIALIFSLLLIIIFLSGCGEDEHPSGLEGVESDFYGIWIQKENNDPVGGFGIGDTHKFNSDKTYEVYWSHGGAIHHYGTWEKSKNLTNLHQILIITFGEKETIYYYDFFDKYTTLRLKEENSDDYIYYYKQ